MDKSELEKYKREMMNLYGRSSSRGETESKKKESPREDEAEENTDDASPEIVPEEIKEVDPDARDDTAYGENAEDEAEASGSGEEDYNSRYPDPDLEELDLGDGSQDTQDDRPPIYPDDESLGDSEGFILVNVRTGDESNAVEGASVVVSAIVAGKRVMIAGGTTDESGTAPKFTVPAPDPSHSQGPDSLIRPYSLYDVSVTAKGFFNARSVDVPAFAGITSVQNFSMIPVPLMMDPDSETVVTYNREPNFGGDTEEVK